MATTTKTRKPLSPVRAAAYAAEREAKLGEAQERLVAAIESMVTGDDWQRMLETSAKFHKYSFGNVIMITVQNPEATQVAGYNKWLELGRQVRKGEKAIQILAPLTYSRKDEVTGEKVSGIRGFRFVNVFDVSQTEGDPIPDIRPTLLSGDDLPVVWDQIQKQIEAHGYTVERGNCNGANGYTDPIGRKVRVRSDVSGAQALKTLVHELAHIECGHCDTVGAYSHRGRCEVEAESTAYLVCQHIGLESDSYSFPYVARWADGDVDLIKKTANTVIKAAHKITETVEAHDAAEVAS